MALRRMELGLLAILLASCGETASAPDRAVKADAPEGGVAPVEEPPRNPTRNAYFGDLHIHTGNSFDAYMFNVRRSPDDAYRFAKGKPIPHDAGYEIQLQGPPLDFLAVTDHGEYLGVVPAMDTPGHPLAETQIARRTLDSDAEDASKAYQELGASAVFGDPIEEIRDQSLMNTIWAETVAAAERHNDPGRFTTFAGYEYTSMRTVPSDPAAAANLHRNVIFADAAPERIFTALDSPNPENLWSWMTDLRETGVDSLAIPHNSNASNGEMFALSTYDGAPLSEAYALGRLANEPLVEITQLKGTSETHPLLSPNDEWAGHEQYKFFIGSAQLATVGEGDFVRPALARGLAVEQETGANPYAFGLVGSSDTHIAAATLREETHWGKFPIDGAGPQSRSSVPPEGYDNWENLPPPSQRLVKTSSRYSASGLAAVWADANTREDIFSAMRRRETFGTTGPRLKVRFFAGDYAPDVLGASDLLEQAYAGGVPMGGELETDADASPVFLAWAMRDPLSAPLQRLQVVKVWAEEGEAREEVHDVACSGDAAPDPETHRCPDNGASVDLYTCETEPGTGAGQLLARWTDPDWQDGQSAAYYVRVLENPTCRWSTWDAVRAGTPRNPALPASLQERAWSSPIWIE